MTLRLIPAADDAALGDYRRFPGSRIALRCADCGWVRGYDPEKVIDRLRQLRAGGHETPLKAVARRVSRRCPRCKTVGWTASFAWPANLDQREIKRLANLYRN